MCSNSSLRYFPGGESLCFPSEFIHHQAERTHQKCVIWHCCRIILRVWKRTFHHPIYLVRQHLTGQLGKCLPFPAEALAWEVLSTGTGQLNPIPLSWETQKLRANITFTASAQISVFYVSLITEWWLCFMCFHVPLSSPYHYPLILLAVKAMRFTGEPYPMKIVI